VLKGIVWGGAAQLAVVIMQFLGLFQLTVTLGLTAPDSDFTNTFLGRWRPPGMYGTNATPAVAALAIPAAIGLVDEGRGKGRWIILAVTVALATCVATLTRSTVLVIAVLMIVWGMTKLKDVKKVGAAVLVVAATVITVAHFGPPGGWQRWENASLESGNASARIESTLGSLKLSISEPLGLGRDQYSHELQGQYGKSRTHNAFTYLALAANLPLAITMFVYLLGRGMAVLQDRSFESWLAVAMFGLCFWEEYFRNPVFIMMGILVILSGIYQRPHMLTDSLNTDTIKK
jgi:chromate transport protein ChrA